MGDGGVGKGQGVSHPDFSFPPSVTGACSMIKLLLSYQFSANIEFSIFGLTEEGLEFSFITRIFDKL